MPAKTKVTPEMILDCAFSIARSEGIKSVNARRIGKELNCSLQPVYYYFKTMDALREQIIIRANEVYNHYTDQAKLAEKSLIFKTFGRQYLKFAQEEKELFKLLFMRDANLNNTFTVTVDDKADYVRHELMELWNLSSEEADTIYYEIWVAIHGIASMIATNYMTFSEEQISKLLDDYFFGLLMCVMEKRKNLKK